MCNFERHFLLNYEWHKDQNLVVILDHQVLLLSRLLSLEQGHTKQSYICSFFYAMSLKLLFYVLKSQSKHYCLKHSDIKKKAVDR